MILFQPLPQYSQSQSVYSRDCQSPEKNREESTATYFLKRSRGFFCCVPNTSAIQLHDCKFGLGVECICRKSQPKYCSLPHANYDNEDVPVHMGVSLCMRINLRVRWFLVMHCRSSHPKYYHPARSTTSYYSSGEDPLSRTEVQQPIV